MPDPIFRIFASTLVLLLPASVFAARPVPRPLPGAEPQFGVGGLAASKLLQQFHLPSSPNDLLAFTLEYALKQKLGNTLPLTLDANSAFPTVENGQLPGGAFHPQPLPPTSASLRAALPAGDYVVPVMAYCTQYSVHRPGQGTAYKLAPVQGTQAEAISTLLWRGTLAGKSPQELQATNWAIQSGVPYGSLPKPYQALIDQLIPEYRNRLKGNAMEVAEATYREVTTDPRKFLQEYIHEHYGKTIPLMLLPKMAVPAPPLDVLLVRMGPAGALVLDAKRQSNVLLTAYTTRERGEQVLFAGQGAQDPPQPAAEGPWTVRIPGVAYMRFVIQGGNMQRDNLMQIRILPSAATTTAANTDGPSAAHPVLLRAGYAAAARVPAQAAQAPAAAAVPPTSVYGLLGVSSFGGSDTGSSALVASGVIGYSQGGQGAQAQIPVALPVAPAHRPTATITVLTHNRTYFQRPPEAVPRKEGIAETGLCVYLGAKISDPDHVYATYRWIQRIHLTKRNECGNDFVDPCDTQAPDPQHTLSDLWYRPKELDGEWAAEAQELGYDRLFRDMPARPLSDLDTPTWQATTELVGVHADESFDEKDALATVVWGFTKGRGNLNPGTVTINGSLWQGRPAITGKQATYLCDPNEWLKADPKDHNKPIPPMPPAYQPGPMYRLYP